MGQIIHFDLIKDHQSDSNPGVSNSFRFRGQFRQI